MSDPDFVRLQRAASPPEHPDLNAFLLDREKTFAPVAHDAVTLRYGRRYAFRVRLADLTHGGPVSAVELPDDENDRGGFTAETMFQRRRRPGAVEIKTLPTPEDLRLVARRSTLRFPELCFAGDGLLDDDADAILKGKPDPDVVTLRIRLDVRALAGDRVEWQQLYEFNRAFATDEISIPVKVVDVPRLEAFQEIDPIEPLPIPAQRELRSMLTALGKSNPGYFANDAAREGLATIIPLKANARAEGPLISFTEDARQLLLQYARPRGECVASARPARAQPRTAE